MEVAVIDLTTCGVAVAHEWCRHPRTWMQFRSGSVAVATMMQPVSDSGYMVKARTI